MKTKGSRWPFLTCIEKARLKMNQSNVIKVWFLLMIVGFSGACSSDNSPIPDAIGKISAQKIIQQFPIFEANYQSFTLNEQEKRRIAHWPSDLSITGFFGTWCHDSQREVPKLFRIAETNPRVNYLWLALDRQKEDPEALAKQAKVQFTPTIIVFRSGIEIGRIIERPKVSLVDDIDNMINATQ